MSVTERKKLVDRKEITTACAPFTGIWPHARRVVLAALLLWPNICLMFVTAESYSWMDRFLLVAFAALSVALPLAWSRSVRAVWLWNLPVALAAGIYGAYIIYFRAPPYSGLWGALWSTSFRELAELALHFRDAMLLGIGSFLLYVGLAWSESRRPMQLPRYMRSMILGAAVWSILCVLGIPTIWVFPDIQYLKPVREEAFYSSYPPGTAAQAIKAVVRASVQQVAENPPVVYRATPGREIFVQIVGESEQFARWEKQLEVSGASFYRSASTILFRDNMSQANFTHLALPLILTGAGSVREAQTLPTWLQFAQARDCKTGWLATNEFDGQRLYRNSLDFVYDLHDITRGIDAEIYDDMMLPEIRRILAQGPQKLCLLVHMNGSHMDYTRRYRPGQARYRANLSDDGVRAAYDNSLLKSIAFVDGVIGELEKLPDALAFLVYSPDHGDNMMEDSRRLVAHGQNPPTKYEAKIPLVVWASNAFQHQYPAQWQTMQMNAGLPTSNRYLFSTLLWAMGIERPGQNTIPTLFDDASTLRGFKRTIATSEDLIYDEESVH